MSKEAIILSTTARSAIVSTFVDALSTNESTGSLVTQVCDVARKYLKGDPVSADDSASIEQSIAKARGWGRNVMKQRTSEVRAVLRSYGHLPEAIKTFRDRTKRCQWTDALKMARKIAKGASVAQAVTFASKKGNGAVSNPVGRLAGAFATCFDELSGAKRRALVEAARVLTDAKVITFTGKKAEKFANA